MGLRMVQHNLQHAQRKLADRKMDPIVRDSILYGYLKTFRATHKLETIKMEANRLVERVVVLPKQAPKMSLNDAYSMLTTGAMPDKLAAAVRMEPAAPRPHRPRVPVMRLYSGTSDMVIFGLVKKGFGICYPPEEQESVSHVSMQGGSGGGGAVGSVRTG